ncbi:Ser/Thr protein kinase RdoA (MazF antagonist) [Mucilaginibacter oryzae]|uniref:Ser/Thr protein kinase RdoA (MazF antagonist) n=1 Tax=Mucilaginibacter oryzae TaxID=468058 RepID=A0A316HDH7_9SPHI|nr:phosphotransferase [Mucilaginibacter oryzae]PWK78283.1 Ser/Thr protein kinase RdoA (MazF antagonist) [Mucilaginibacter oryzae]
MEIFPTQYSTLSSKALNIRLSENYGLTGTTCRLLIRNVSDTYIIENNAEKYIFKIYRDSHRKLAEIKGEVALLNLLVENGARVSTPIPAINGELLQVFNAAEGTRYGVLFSWAQGKPVYTMTDHQLDTVGREMALLHQISSSIQLNYPRRPYSVETAIINPLRVVAPAFAGLDDEYNYLKNTATEVIARYDYFTPNFSYGYCHFDFLPKNFHFDESDGITFFDFDFAGQGLLAYDITSFVIHFFLEFTFGRIMREEARRAVGVFVESYRKVKPLSDEEIAAIPYLGFGFWIFYLGFQYENYDDWSNIFWGVKFLKERTALIKKWMETAHLLLP